MGLTTAPGGQTNAWKTLPLDQKKRMLDYIRDRRMRKPPASEAGEGEGKGDAPTPDAASEPAPRTAPEPPPASKTDPYLQMLQRRTLRSAPANSGDSVHPNSAYVGPAAVAEYAESAREAKKRLKARWKLAEAEFYEHECVCGVTHAELKGAKATLLHTISAMMSTFGDADKSCVTTVEEVHYLGKSVLLPHADELPFVVLTGFASALTRAVGELIRQRLQTMDPDELAEGSCLRVTLHCTSDVISEPRSKVHRCVDWCA